MAGFWNDIFLYGHHINDPSENDTNTIGNDLGTQINPVNFH